MTVESNIQAGSGQSPGTPSRPGIPAPAAWLGAFGLIPFVGLAVASLTIDPAYAIHVHFLIATYGAVILSFLGGVHWGLAIMDRRYIPGERAPVGRLVAGVIPSLIGWGALMIGAPWDLYALSCAFLLLFLLDMRIAGTGGLPAWYPRLRLPLTAIVVLSLICTAILGQPVP